MVEQRYENEMNEAFAVTQSGRNMLCVELHPKIDDVPIHMFGACVDDLQPAIDRCTEQYGSAVTLAALVSLVAQEAAECGVPMSIMDRFQAHTRLPSANGARPSHIE